MKRLVVPSFFSASVTSAPSLTTMRGSAVTLDATPDSLTVREVPAHLQLVTSPASAPQPAVALPVELPERVRTRTSRSALRGFWRMCSTTGWVVGFLTQMYALYLLCQGLLALQRVARWSIVRRWTAKVQYTLRELEIQGIERFGGKA